MPMDEFDRQLQRKVFHHGGSYDQRRADRVREEVRRMYDEKMRVVLNYTWGYLVLGIVIMMGGFFMLATSQDLRGMITGAMLSLFGVSITVLIKLWYWIMNDKWSVLREIKELQVQMAEMTERLSPGDGESG